MTMKNLIDIIETTHQKCSNLDFDDWEDFLAMFVCVIGFDIEKQRKRIFGGDPDILLVDFLSELFDTSKSELRKLIKNNGIKLNNKVPSQDLRVKDIPWIDLGVRKVCVIKVGKNKFDFIIS